MNTREHSTVLLLVHFAIEPNYAISTHTQHSTEKSLSVFICRFLASIESPIFIYLLFFSLLFVSISVTHIHTAELLLSAFASELQMAKYFYKICNIGCCHSARLNRETNNNNNSLWSHSRCNEWHWCARGYNRCRVWLCWQLAKRIWFVSGRLLNLWTDIKQHIYVYISIRCSLSSLDVSVLVSSLSVWLACPFSTNVRASCDFSTTSCAVAVSVCVCGCWDWLCMCCRALWWFLMIKGRRKIYALSLVTTNQIPVGVSHIHTHSLTRHAHSMRFHRAQLSSTHRTALALHTFCIFVADLRYVFFFFLLLFPIAIYSHFVRREREMHGEHSRDGCLCCCVRCARAFTTFLYPSWQFW